MELKLDESEFGNKQMSLVNLSPQDLESIKSENDFSLRCFSIGCEMCV